MGAGRGKVILAVNGGRGGLRTLVVGLLLALTVVAVFSPCLRLGFTTFDDDIYVTRNPVVSAGITAHGLRWAFTSSTAANWHPLTWLSHMLDVQWFGLNPRGHHAVSVLLHGMNALLLLLVIRAGTGALWRAVLVAALFALHPLRLESVAWIAERKDLLSAFFGLLALASYLRYVRRPGLPRLLTALSCYSLSLLAKPMLVTLPLLLLLLDFWPLNRLWAGPGRLRPRGGGAAPAPRLVLGEKLPFLALALVSSLLTLQAQSSGGAVLLSEAYSLPQRLGLIVLAYGHYVRTILVPAGLAAIYPRTAQSPLGWQGATLAALLLASVALASLSARRRPALATGWLWFLVGLVPVIGLVPVGPQFAADRYTYLPAIGIGVMIAWAAGEAIVTPPARRGAVAAVSLCLAALAALSWRQAHYWKDTLTLFSRALAVSERNWVAHLKVGESLLVSRDYSGAVLHLQEALQLNPEADEAAHALGFALAKQARFPEATSAYARALRIDPGNARARGELGLLLVSRGSLEEGIAHLRESVRLDPDLLDAHYQLGRALLSLGHPNEARRHLSLAFRNLPEAERAARIDSALGSARPRGPNSDVEAGGLHGR